MPKAEVLNQEDGTKLVVILCPGCKRNHGFTVGPGRGPRWTWNGSTEAPTFSPSMLVNKDHPEGRCHSFVTDGRIKFLTDSFHDLKGRTVDLPEMKF